MSDDRDLLAALLEALTVPYDAGRYDARLSDRASWARTTLKGALEDGDPAWHADFLRRAMREEEAGK